MNYTIQDYQNAQSISSDWMEDRNALADFGDYCDAKAAELSKPKQKLYKCIKSVPFQIWKIGDKISNHATFNGISVSELPFHFELIEEPVSIELINLPQVVADLDRIIKTVYDKDMFKEVCLLNKRIKQEHDL